MNIAVLITCHNRKEKTLGCLANLYGKIAEYNSRGSETLNLYVYITDDGCTDGTFEAIKDLYVSRSIYIVKGDGSLYWAGGMRAAWREAMRSAVKWDFYLLLNDDTVLLSNCFDELLATHQYCLKRFGTYGIYSGACCSRSNRDITSYGGDVIIDKTGAHERIKPSGIPQPLDMANANILLVPAGVVEKIGIFYDGYVHSYADYDYALQAKKAGIPVLLTSKHCGACDYDHLIGEENAKKIKAMSLKERISYFSNPLHSNRDHLIYIYRNFPFKLPFAFLFRCLHVITPWGYYFITKGRERKNGNLYK